MTTAQWRIVGQGWHAVIGHGRDHDGELYCRTACGWLVWPSVLDARLRDAPQCGACADRYPRPK
ncbi:hypothetical protein FHU38_000982 [Saccharomonospora amisosensis]|uniref:Uncharacterized protein n=1 Tax=Saccharomonospora amisosensis TaxID=1128677 RepID=A0A7X5UMA2_9PSEU|nr:hypothetical protein [Saccharomonospora amisosensis]NIJ10638.1 hypothetical protein [Saccharomonospora amisosensis]